MERLQRLDNPRIYFTGVGGQGTLTATKLLGHAAMEAGVEVVGGEVHGMAQRGGVVESFLLMGGWRAPRLDLGEADILLGFEPLETLRGLPYLGNGGAVFSSMDPLPPLGVNLGNDKYPGLDYIRGNAEECAGAVFFLPCNELAEEAGSIRCAGTVLLGALCASGILPFGAAQLKDAICAVLPPKTHAVNIAAMEKGVLWLNGA